MSVGFCLQSLPPLLRVPNALARGLGIAAPRLTPENLARAATRKAGLSRGLPGHVEQALEVLCRSFADEAALHWFGRMNQWNLIVTGLAALLRIEQLFEDDPTLDETELIAPLIVTGLPRSGTTFLHRLLSTLDANDPVALYQHIFPYPRRPDTRKLEAKAIFEPWRRASRVYDLDAIHHVRPALPDECNFGMRLGLRSMIYWSTAPTYSYLRWVLEQDLREAYRLYRRVLLLHQRQAPTKRLTLKCPQHLAWLPALCEALPEAHIIQTHRDPLQTVPSECKLILSLHGVSTTALDWRRTVDHNRLKVRTYAARSVAFSRTPEAARVIHVNYQDLVSDPVALAADICRRVGLDYGPEDDQILGSFFGRNRQHKHGKNHYSLEQFELDPDELRANFEPYCERFLPGLS